VQAFAERDQSYNARFRIPSFDEGIALAKRKGAEEGRTIGVYPETNIPPATSKTAWPSRTACCMMSAACLNVVDSKCADANGDGLVNDADR
jgi:glycerophosphoryl diester phosphodiesterase